MSGSSGNLLLAGTLTALAVLQVTVPDGPNAGIYAANAVGPLRWAVSIAGVAHELFCGGSGAGLAIAGPAGAADATSAACNPFSSTFPPLFGATLNVVVTET